MTELSDLTKFWNVHGNPVNYGAHGRVYKSPHKPRETWFTIGLGFRNAQIYPKFEPWMRGFTTDEQYSEFTKFLEREFDESRSEQSATGQICSLLSFALTMGICFCCFLYYFYTRRRLRSFRSRTVALFNNKTKSMGLHNVHLNFSSRINEGDENCWTDSKNKILGPPLGFSIVFTHAEEMQWPPVETCQKSAVDSLHKNTLFHVCNQ